jgi:hypothetical protein
MLQNVGNTAAPLGNLVWNTPSGTFEARLDHKVAGIDGEQRGFREIPPGHQQILPTNQPTGVKAPSYGTGRSTP